MNHLNEIISRLINKILLIVDSYKLEVDKFTMPPNSRSEFALSLMNAEDLNHLRCNRSSEFSEYKYKVLKNRIKDRQKKVYVVKYKGDISGYFCVAFEDTYESGIKGYITVDNKAYYLFDDYVFMQYRGKRIHEFSVLERIKESNNDEKKYALVVIYRNNKKSRYTYERLGFKRSASYYYIPLFKRLFLKSN